MCIFTDFIRGSHSRGRRIVCRVGRLWRGMSCFRWCRMWDYGDGVCRVVRGFRVGTFGWSL